MNGCYCRNQLVHTVSTILSTGLCLFGETTQSPIPYRSLSLLIWSAVLPNMSLIGTSKDNQISQNSLGHFPLFDCNQTQNKHITIMIPWWWLWALWYDVTEYFPRSFHDALKMLFQNVTAGTISHGPIQPCGHMMRQPHKIPQQIRNDKHIDIGWHTNGLERKGNDSYMH